MPGDNANPTTRFTNRAADYAKFRPSYPPELLRFVSDQLDLRGEHVIADVGSGTGILTQILLDNGNIVYGVEPNEAMAQVAEAEFAGNDRFHSVRGSAETTTLADHTVNFIFAAQAFHWFDAPRTRPEFQRVLRHGGIVVLVWNSRRLDSTPFLSGYEALLREFGTDYKEVSHKYKEAESLQTLFGDRGHRRVTFDNLQSLDYDGLQGRLLSSSYAPPRGHPRHEPMLAALRELFARHESDGQVVIEYDTDVFYGRLSAIGDPTLTDGAGGGAE